MSVINVKKTKGKNNIFIGMQPWMADVISQYTAYSCRSLTVVYLIRDKNIRIIHQELWNCWKCSTVQNLAHDYAASHKKRHHFCPIYVRCHPFLLVDCLVNDMLLQTRPCSSQAPNNSGGLCIGVCFELPRVCFCQNLAKLDDIWQRYHRNKKGDVYYGTQWSGFAKWKLLGICRPLSHLSCWTALL